MQDANTLIREGLTAYLTDAQLLATLLGVTEDRARKVLQSIPLQRTAQLEVAELQHAAGLTERQARTIAAAAAYGRRTCQELPDMPHSVNCPKDAANILQPQPDHRTQEELHLLLLTTRNQVISRHMIYRGNINSTVVRPAEVIRPAILAAAPSIIISHNHPGGDPTPSSADVAITKTIQEAAALMGITLLDHVVTAPDGRWVSLKETKMMQEIRLPPTQDDPH